MFASPAISDQATSLALHWWPAEQERLPVCGQAQADWGTPFRAHRPVSTASPQLAHGAKFRMRPVRGAWVA